MTIEEHRFFCEGRNYWWEYININGVSFRPNDKGIRKLAKQINVDAKYIRKCINTFLDPQ